MCDWNQRRTTLHYTTPYHHTSNPDPLRFNESARRGISQVPSIECFVLVCYAYMFLILQIKIAWVYVTGLRGHFDFIHWEFPFNIYNRLHTVKCFHSFIMYSIYNNIVY